MRVIIRVIVCSSQGEFGEFGGFGEPIRHVDKCLSENIPNHRWREHFDTGIYAHKKIPVS